MCTATIPWYKSCKNLLLRVPIKVIFYFNSFLIIILNIVSIILQKVSFEKGIDKSRAFGTLVAAVNIEDIICALPLFALWIVDLWYKGEFMIEDKNWRSGMLCFLIFGINIQFSFTSPLFLCLLSYSRYKVVDQPLDTQFKETNYVFKFIMVIFICTGLLTIGLILLSYFLIKENPTALCSPFVDPTNSIILVKIFTWLSVIIQIFAISFICFTYGNLIKTFKKSNDTMKTAMSMKRSIVPLLIQLITVTISNIICWIPSSIIYLTSMLIDKYPVEMLVWTVVVIVPINSIINPIVFIITTVRKYINDK